MIVVIPWAGQNRRFQDEGIFTPKLMLRMPDGRRLLSWILDSIPSPKRIVLVGRREHETEWGRKLAHFRLPPDVSLHCLWLDRPSIGPLDAVLRARRYFHTNDNLMIHYSDCLTSTGAAQITMDECLASPPAGDAAAVVFDSSADRFSWDPNGVFAVGGVFWFRSAARFLRAARKINGPGVGVPAVVWTMKYELWPMDDYVDLGIPSDYHAFMASQGALHASS